MAREGVSGSRCSRGRRAATRVAYPLPRHIAGGPVGRNPGIPHRRCLGSAPQRSLGGHSRADGVGGIRLSLLWVRGMPRLFDFFFWLFVYIFMGIAPTAQIRSGLISTTTPGWTSALDMPTAGMIVLGVACYEIGRLVWILLEHRRIDRGGPARRSRGHKVARARSCSPSHWCSVRTSCRSSVHRIPRKPGGVGAAREAAWPDPAVRAHLCEWVSPMLVAVGALGPGAPHRGVPGSAASRSSPP